MARRKNFVDNASVSLDVKFAEDTTNKYQNVNNRFTIKKTSVMTHEQVANMFKFEKDLILSKFNQLDMLPIVGYFEDGEPTSHDSKAVPYGAVLPNSARFEDVDGEEYLVVDSCLWSGRYPEVKDVSNFNESMEILEVKALFNKEQKYYDVSDFTFDCLCMLNKDVNPAFKKARMDVDANFNDDFEAFKAEFAEVLQDINKNVTKNGSEKVENGNKEFALIDLERLWCSIYDFLIEKYPDNDYGTIYRIEGIYEENGQKFVVLNKKDDNNLYIVDFSINEEGNLVMAEEAKVAISAIIETGEVTKFEEPENVDKLKIFEEIENKDEPTIDNPDDVKMEDEPIVEPTVEPIVEPESTNYEELYTELQSKFNELVAKCSDLETEIVPLRQFKAEVETKENQAKAEMELKEKNDLIESFATKLPKKSIDDIIDDVTKFTLDEIKMKLSIALADQILADEKEDKKEFSDITINIDNMNKSVSREERLIAEIKSKKKKIN